MAASYLPVVGYKTGSRLNLVNTKSNSDRSEMSVLIDFSLMYFNGTSLELQI